MKEPFPLGGSHRFREWYLGLAAPSRCEVVPRWRQTWTYLRGVCTLSNVWIDTGGVIASALLRALGIGSEAAAARCLDPGGSKGHPSIRNPEDPISLSPGLRLNCHHPAMSAILLAMRLAADLMGPLARWAYLAVVWTLL